MIPDCPANSTTNSSSNHNFTSIFDCKCRPGFQGSDGSPCLPCPVNTYKNVLGASQLRCVAVCCSVALFRSVVQCFALYCSVLLCIAVYCSVIQLLQCVAACCSVLQRVAVRCSVLQRWKPMAI